MEESGMRNTRRMISIGRAVLLSLAVCAPAAALEIRGTLQDVSGKSLSGTITVIQETPNLRFTHHEVDDSGEFEFTATATGALLLHARAPSHPTAEHLIAAGTSGPVTVNFALPSGQNVKVRVVDDLGDGVPGAALRVRYHEPEKPIRRVAFETDDVTDGDGYQLLQHVGIQVPFVVDVLAPNYPPMSSKQTKLSAGTTEMQDIALGPARRDGGGGAGRQGRESGFRGRGPAAGGPGGTAGRVAGLVAASAACLPATRGDVLAGQRSF